MKILFFITGLTRGGAERQLFNLIHGLKQTKKDVVPRVITLVAGDYCQELRKIGVEVKTYLDSEQPSRDILGYLKFFQNAVKEFKPQIVHSFLFDTNVVAKLALFLMGKDFRLVCSYRSLVTKFPRSFFLEYLNMWRVDLLIANSRQAERALQYYRVFCPRTKVIYNGFLPGEVDPQCVRTLKKTYQGKRIVLTVANFRTGKDYRTNLLSCQELLKWRADVLFLYVGHGPELEQTRQRACQLGLEPQVRFLGKRSDVLELLQVADVFFLPTLFESQSNALIEAMYSRVPIVTTDLPENRELVQHGLFCRRRDYRAMARAINKVLDGGCSQDWLNGNQQFVTTQLSWEKMVNEYYLTYRRLLAKSR